MGDIRFETPVIRECAPLNLDPVDAGPFLFNKTSFYSQCGKEGITSRDYAKLKVDNNGIRVWFKPYSMDTEDSFDIYINKYGQMFGDLPKHGYNDVLDIVDCAAKLYPEDLKPAITKVRTIIKEAALGRIRPECNNSIDFWGLDLGLVTLQFGMPFKENYHLTTNDDPNIHFEHNTLYLSSTGAVKRASSNTYSKELFDEVLSAVIILFSANPESEYIKGLLTFLQMAQSDKGTFPAE